MVLSEPNIKRKVYIEYIYQEPINLEGFIFFSQN